MKQKKGQGGEMIGLLVIIILILVLVAIYFRFASKEDSTITTQTRATTTASNLLNAMMQYTLCSGKDIEEAVKVCAKGDGPICGKKSACEVIKIEAKNILENTLTGKLEENKLIIAIRNPSDGSTLLQVPEGIELDCSTIIYPKTGEIVSLFPGRIEVTIGQCIS